MSHNRDAAALLFRSSPGVVTKGGPNFATMVLPLYIYQNGFEYLKFGLASAMTLAMFALTAAMVGVQLLVLRAWRAS